MIVGEITSVILQGLTLDSQTVFNLCNTRQIDDWTTGSKD